LANHDVTLAAVSRAPIEKLQAYKRRMGWSFPWASSAGNDFNYDFQVGFTKEQQRSGAAVYNYRATGHGPRPNAGEVPEVAEMAATTGTDVAPCLREAPGISACAQDEGVGDPT